MGLISDTHGLLRPEASAFLRGCHHIIHGGDIGSREVLQELAAIAPTTAVRGNNDRGAWAGSLAETELIRFDEVVVYVVHDLSQLDIEPQAAGVGVVISGHSHQPRVEKRNGVLFVNPGSAGPRRFKLPVTLGELSIAGMSVAAHIADLSAKVGSLPAG